nr:MAG TPA: hypothetical protein [Caudoviricetes sp.]
MRGLLRAQVAGKKRWVLGGRELAINTANITMNRNRIINATKAGSVALVLTL